MKKILLILFLFVCLINEGKAQTVPMPDGFFQDHLRNLYPSCFTLVGAQWHMDTACNAITSEDTLAIPAGVVFGTTDIEGLQYFDNLKYFSMKGSNVELSAFSHLISMPSSLEYFWFDGVSTPNGLPVLNNGLRTLASTRGDLRFLPSTLPDSLRILAVQDNQISVLPSLPQFLERLLCSNQRGVAPATNVLTALPTLPASLKALHCSGNALSALPPLPAGLRYLECSNQNRNINPQDIELTFGTLPDLPASLDTLFCAMNKLTSLPALPAGLKVLWVPQQRHFEDDLIVGGSPNVVHNGLSQLPPLPAGLDYLNCSYNNLQALPPLPSTLRYLEISNNVRTHGQVQPSQGISTLGIPLRDGFKVLDVSNTLIDCIPHIPASMQAVLTSGSRVTCLPNSGNYTATPVRLLCNSTNNVNQCPAFPVIAGELFYDHNSNGIRDANENGRANVEVQISSGLTAYSNINGYFEITGDTGTNVITVIAPTPYISVPPTATYVFNSFDTLVYGAFALQPTITIDSLRVTIVNGSTPRPGFDFGYTVNYENVGTTVLSSNMQIAYDAANLTYVDASIPGVTNNAGVLTIPAINTTPGDRGSFSVSFNVSSGAQLNYTLLGVISATINASIVRDSIFNLISGSYDPNNKNATPSLTPAQVSDGTFINYLVRFQNTGTDTAFNVVVTDTLEARLDASSFQMLEASHPAIIKRNGQALTFEFLNIQLPDSNVNEPLSHGYIKFRVKPVNTLIDGDVVNNKASIYFDYNAPVVTNNAITTVTSPVTCFTATAVTTPASCPGVNNGSITVTVSGGTAPFAYALNGIPPQSSTTFTGVPAGLHTVVITDANGCTGTVNISVAAGAGFTAASSTSAASCGQSDGMITVMVNGGASPYLYSLDNGPQQSSASFGNVAGGTHSITITDANGCTASVTAIVGETSISATVTTTQPTCVTQGSILVTSPTGTAPFMYSVNGGTLQSSATFDNLTAGTYSVVVQDANMCTYTEAVTINAAPASVTPSVSITASASTICVGDPVTFTATPTNGGASPQYQWLVNGTNAGTNAATLTINPVVNSDVSVQLTSNDPCASPATATSNVVTITVNAAQTPSITIAGTTTVTAGSSASITSAVVNAGAAPFHQWQDSTSTHTWTNIAGATNSSIHYTPQQTGDGLRAILTSTATCTSSSSATSDALYFTVETTTTPRMRLYPNPVRSILTIENNSQTQWVSADIFDDNGRRITTYRNSNTSDDVIMDAYRLMPGVYFIRLIDRNGNPEYFKFIKQ